ncbi:NAD-dependent succinate-semialdehyde dehydrogenase [Limibacter armeniacum]|uniref:NAD-dependent succinate-semialdehyde dehydrogenase n=1 Tax=Limibacter armeniacum TaxID=466084 RepID=UPI002FE58DC7
MQDLNNPKLFKQQAFIDGQWVGANDNKTFSVRNPFDESVIAELPDMGKAETQKAIEAAHDAFPAWKDKTAAERSAILRKWFDLQMEYVDDLGKILTTEQGKPLEEAKGEIRYGASFVEWFAEEAKRIYGDVIPGHAADKRIVVIKQPIGVVGAITPWNFPNAMITRKIAPALAAGCPVVVKPSKDTPLSALALAELAEQAGFPKGVFNVITSSNSKVIGEEITTNPLVKKVSFTGSTEVGKILMKQASGTVKKVSLELGGNAPFIVFDDADLDAAVEGAIASKYRNAGQTCVCANRLYAQEGIYDQFVEKLAEAVRNLKVGNGMEKKVNIGPLINQDALDKVEDFVDDAKQKGAKVITGGNKHKLGGTFYEPTVLSEANEKMKLTHEEIFGPVAPVYRFKTDEEAIKVANDTPFGLASYFYGRDISRIWNVAEGLEYGMVGINTGMISTAVAPFGGIKESGMGREGSKYGIEDYIVIKYLCFGI